MHTQPNVARTFFNVSSFPSTPELRSIPSIYFRSLYLTTISPLPDRTSGLDTDKLVVEVWDFDPAESFTEKLSSVNNVKGIRGFRRLLKEITTSALNEANLNELIGSHEIPLTVSYRHLSPLFFTYFKFYYAI